MPISFEDSFEGGFYAYDGIEENGGPLTDVKERLQRIYFLLGGIIEEM